MKRTIIVTLFLMLAVVAFSQTVPRVVRQQLILDPAYPVDILDHITNTGQTHNPNYVLRVENINTGVEKGTDLANCPPSVIRIFKSGNDSVGWTVNAIFNQSMWPAAWIPGEQLKIKIWYTVDTGIAAGVDPYPNYEYVEKILEVPTGTGSVQLTDAADRLIIPPAPQGAPTYQFTVNSNYVGAAIYKDGNPTGEVTPHNFVGETADIAGLYTVVMDDVVWTPADYNYAGTADETVVFMGVKTPGFATNPYPADQADIEIAHDAAATTYNLTWEAPAGLVPDGYKIIWGENAAVDLGDALTWTTPEIAEGTYTWSVIPYITDPAAPAKGLTRGAVEQTRSMPALQAKVVHQTKGEPAGAPIWSFTITRLAPPPVPDYPAGENTPIPGTDISLNPSEDLDNVATDPTASPFAELPNLDTTITTLFGLQGTGNNVTLTFTFTGTDDWYVAFFFGGIWHYATPYPVMMPERQATIVVDFSAKGTVYGYASKGDDPTLPVELSYFNAVLTAENFVNLTWISQSETEMLGYRVYRNESDDQSNALLLTPSMIPATNTSTEQRYSLEDREVEIGNTYWYWLESVDYATTHIHGPVSMTVTGEIPPVLPTVTSMKNAYPNPFKQANSTTIDVSIKAGENGTVTVYNILGQAVKTFSVSEGNHKLTWNGKDARGNNCGSGIYFYKLSTPSTNMTKKMVIVK